MTEQWEVTLWHVKSVPASLPPGWEPFAENARGIWLRRCVPTQTYVTGAQQSQLNEYPAQVGQQRALTEAERRMRDEAARMAALRNNQPS